MSSGHARSSKKKRVDFVADFETTTTADDCRVWAWGLARVDTPDDVKIGNDLAEFLNEIAAQNTVVYFHNLKFDGTFILDWLLRNGYDYVDSQFALSPGTFTALISTQNKFYSINVRWSNGKTTQFRDSLKKLPMSVENVAKAFKMEEGKGELDYTAYRAVGHVITDEEADYIRRDVAIIANAMKLTLAEGMTRLTVASDSLAEFKHLFGAKAFARMFPVLPETLDNEIRKAYRGGFTYADPRYSGKPTKSGLVLDVNSLYPHIMYSSLLPYGEPEYVSGYVEPTKSHPLTIFSLTFTAKIKPNHIPCIQIKGSAMFTGTEYLSEIVDPTTLTITNVDLELWEEHYDIDVISYDGGYRFHGVEGVFDRYIDKWSKVKQESKGGRREIAKLHLNSLYGKFASNPNVTGKIPTLEGDIVRFHTGPEETRPPVYTAMGVFITAYARALTIRAAQANYDTFAYADTDSLHLLRDDVPVEIDVDPVRRGAWKLEYRFEKAVYVRAKVYLERKWAKVPYAQGEYINRVAGLPERVSAKLTFDDVTDGRVLHGKLQPRNVPGGIILEDKPFTLNL